MREGAHVYRSKHAKAGSTVEVRAGGTVLEFRAAEDGQGPGTIAGYAATFDTLSDDLGGFREVIRAGAFDKSLKDGADVLGIWDHGAYDHSANSLLGRRSSGTLRLEVDKRGLKYEIDLPDTQLGRDARVQIERGDVRESSFAFRSIKEKFEEQDDQVVRSLLEVQLVDVSPVVSPAYPGTEVSLRSLPGPADVTSESLLRGLYARQGLTEDEIRVRLTAAEGRTAEERIALESRRRRYQLAHAAM